MYTRPLNSYSPTTYKHFPVSSGFHLVLAQDEHFTNLNFWISLKQKLLSAHTENTLNGNITTESAYILVNNNTSFKFFRFFLATLYGID
jgi:hypothetical protein